MRLDNISDAKKQKLLGEWEKIRHYDFWALYLSCLEDERQGSMETMATYKSAPFIEAICRYQGEQAGFRRAVYIAQHLAEDIAKFTPSENR
jgi:hypothetical protein